MLCLVLLLALIALAAQDYSTFFASIVNAAPEQTVVGLAVLKTAIPHCDVFVTPEAGPLLVQALVRQFNLPDLVGDDVKAETILCDQAKSQEVMTWAQVEAVAAAAAAEEAEAVATAKEAEAVAAAEDAKAQGAAPEVRRAIVYLCYTRCCSLSQTLSNGMLVVWPELDVVASAHSERKTKQRLRCLGTSPDQCSFLLQLSQARDHPYCMRALAPKGTAYFRKTTHGSLRMLR